MNPSSRLLIGGCLPPVREINSLERRKKRAAVSDGNRGRWPLAPRLNGLGGVVEVEEEGGMKGPPHQSGGPPGRSSPLEHAGEAAPAKPPAAAPRRPGPGAPGGDPSA